MRKELIGRLLGYIYGLEVHPGPLNSMRWQPVAAAFYALKGGDPNTKAFRHGLKTMLITENDFDNLTDNQVIDTYTHVVKQYFTQM